MKSGTAPRIDDLVEHSFERLDALVREKTAELRAAQSVLGPALAAIERKGRTHGFTSLGVTSLAIYMESRGLSPSEGFAMRSAAEASGQAPEVGKAIQQSQLSVPKAALLRDVLAKPELQRPDEDLLATAQRLTTNELRTEVDRRKAEARMPEAPQRRTLFFSRQGVTALVRTRELVSNKLKHSVTESEAAEDALREFVVRNDPEQKARRAQERARARERAKEARAGNAETGEDATREDAGREDAVPAAAAAESASEAAASTEAVHPAHGGLPGGRSTGSRGAPAQRASAPTRHIPAEDRHLVVKRFGDRCWVAGCEDRSRQTFAHGKPFRFGGSNRYWNLARYCLGHHRQFDGGQWRVVIRGENAVLIDRRGLVVGRLRGLPPKAPP